MNLAFVHALGFEGFGNSKAVASDVVRHSLGTSNWIGTNGVRVIAALICISCLGAMNGIIITSPRIYYATGLDFKQLQWLGRWDAVRNQPWLATLAQLFVTLALFALCFSYDDPFEVILIVSAPFFWLFLGLTVLSILLLRRHTKPWTGFRVPGYPLSPVIFAIVCFAMAWESIKHVIRMEYWLAGFGVLFLALIGVLLEMTLKPTQPNSRSE